MPEDTEEEASYDLDGRSVLQNRQHRIVNQLQLLASSMSLQARRASSEAVRDAFSICRDRVEVLGTANALLEIIDETALLNISRYLETLLHKLTEHWRSPKFRVDFDTTNRHAMLPEKDATTLGLVLNELIWITKKHATDDGESGTISLAVEFNREQFEMVYSATCRWKARAHGRDFLAESIISLLEKRLSGSIDRQQDADTLSVLVRCSIGEESLWRSPF